MAQPFSQLYRKLVPTWFDEPWKPEDGLSREELTAALTDSGVGELPESLREFYLAVGAVEDLMEAWYYVWDPDELEIEDGYLLFMEDEDEAYTWGLRVDSLDVADPLVHRRSNTRGNWMDTEATLSEYLLDYYEWVFDEVVPELDGEDSER
jgi:hypothetical protein